MPDPHPAPVPISPTPPIAPVHEHDGDAALAAALQARDPRAAHQAWFRLSPLVHGFLRRFFGPGLERQDLCQEVFLRFFARIDELRKPAALRSFLIGICLGVARNELRRMRVRRWISLTPAGELPEVAVAGFSPEARELVRRLYQVLDRASVEDRLLFVTRYIEKMDISEIAVVQGISVSTVKRRLARATVRIGEWLRAEPELAQYATALLAGEVAT
jgi:RNA polymerase sigma-70 factor (ECF subfamily)